jgi:PleD family two-component response regulator
VSDYITVSMGVAGFIPTPKSSEKSLITIADKALYEAKAQGRNCITQMPKPI